MKIKKQGYTFDGPQIRTLLKYHHFVAAMNTVEDTTWNAFADVIHNFLGNKKADNYREIVEELFFSLQELRSRMSIELHYLLSRLSKFLNNLGGVNEEQVERFYEDITK